MHGLRVAELHCDSRDDLHCPCFQGLLAVGAGAGTARNALGQVTVPLHQHEPLERVLRDIAEIAKGSARRGPLLPG